MKKPLLITLIAVVLLGVIYLIFSLLNKPSESEITFYPQENTNNYISLNSTTSIVKNDADSISKVQTWRELITAGIYEEKCGIKTEKISLRSSSSNSITLSFDYTNCGIGTVKYKTNDKKVIYFPEPVSGEEYYEEGYTLVDYWMLRPAQSTPDFIKSLIAELPSAEERGHCVAVEKNLLGALSYNNSNSKRYEIRPDDYLYKKQIAENPDDLNTFCGPYGLANSMRFFERHGDVLLFIHAGQDIPFFDPTSFKVTR